jgi:cation diffusion facilitator family transporter
LIAVGAGSGYGAAMSEASTNRTVLRLAYCSLAVGVVVLALKGYAAYATGSIALFSDALESIVNLVTATAALIAIRLSAKPADATLPYGYHKAEYFSAVIIGVFIAVAALVIFYRAYEGFVAPAGFNADPVGLAVSAVATAINAGLAWLLLREGRRAKSAALAADGRHLFTDVLSTAGVLVGVLLAAATGWTVLDPVLAVLVGITILWSGWQLIRQSVIGLMDVAVEPATLRTIRELISAHADGAIEAHDIRTRQAGPLTFIEFHLVVPGSMTVDQAHAICDRIEARLKAAVDRAQITIHVEPEDKAKHSGIVVV